MTDNLRACLLCGETMNDLTREQIKRFGKPKCCGREMIIVPIKNLHAIIKSLDKLKVNFEKELVQGFNCDQYLHVEK